MLCSGCPYTRGTVDIAIVLAAVGWAVVVVVVVLAGFIIVPSIYLQTPLSSARFLMLLFHVAQFVLSNLSTSASIVNGFSPDIDILLCV